MGTYMHAHILYYACGYHGICLNHSQSSQEYNSPHYAYKNSKTSIAVSIVRCCSKFCIRKFTKQSLHAPSSSWNATQHLSGMHPGQARYWLHKRQSLLERPLWFLQTKQSRDLTMSNVWLLQTRGGMLEHLKHWISAFKHVHMNIRNYAGKIFHIFTLLVVLSPSLNPSLNPYPYPSHYPPSPGPAEWGVASLIFIYIYIYIYINIYIYIFTRP